MGKNSAFEMSFLLSQGFSPTRLMFFALLAIDWAPSVKSMESLAMYAGDVVCERRKYGAAPFPEAYFGRALLNSYENTAQRIQPAGGYLSSINGFWP